MLLGRRRWWRCRWLCSGGWRGCFAVAQLRVGVLMLLAAPMAALPMRLAVQVCVARLLRGRAAKGDDADAAGGADGGAANESGGAGVRGAAASRSRC